MRWLTGFMAIMLFPSESMSGVSIHESDRRVPYKYIVPWVTMNCKITHNSIEVL